MNEIEDKNIRVLEDDSIPAIKFAPHLFLVLYTKSYIRVLLTLFIWDFNGHLPYPFQNPISNFYLSLEAGKSSTDSVILHKLTNVEIIFRAWTKSIKRTKLYFDDFYDGHLSPYSVPLHRTKILKQVLVRPF